MKMLQTAPLPDKKAAILGFEPLVYGFYQSIFALTWKTYIILQVRDSQTPQNSHFHNRPWDHHKDSLFWW